MARPAPRPPLDRDAPSSSQLPSRRGGDEGGMLAVVQEADVTCEALCDVTQEERRLREYILVARAALDITNGKADEAKATATATQAELADELGFISLRSV